MVVFVFVVVCSMSVLADWGQAESPDFALDTTVPEPALLAAAIVPLWLLRRRQ
jgi:hypothetical protein